MNSRITYLPALDGPPSGERSPTGCVDDITRMSGKLNEIFLDREYRLPYRVIVKADFLVSASRDRRTSAPERKKQMSSVFKSAKTGKFVTPKFAKANPATTFKQTVKRPSPPRKRTK